MIELMVSSQGLEQLHPWQPEIVPFFTGGERSPVFFVHPNTGSAEVYRPAVALMNPDRPCYGINAAAFTDDDIGVSLQTIASHYFEAVRPLLAAKGRAVFAGYSLGGIIAYEMARLHAADGGPALPVMIVDMEARVPRSRLRIAADLVLNLPNWLRRDALQAGPGILIERGVRRIRGIFTPALRHQPPDWANPNPQAMKVLTSAVLNYSGQPYAGPVVLLRCTDRGIFDTRDPAMGWGGFALNLCVDAVPGLHENCLAGANLVSSAEVMGRHLDSFA